MVEACLDSTPEDRSRSIDTGLPAISERPWPSAARLPYAVLTDPVLSDGAKLTYTVLRAFASDYKTCSPPLHQVALIRGIGRSTLWRHLAELEARGAVAREPVSGKRTNWVLHAERCSPRLRIPPRPENETGSPAGETGTRPENETGPSIVHNRRQRVLYPNSSQTAAAAARRLRLRLPDYSDELHARLVATCRRLKPEFDEADLERLVPLCLPPHAQHLGILVRTVPVRLQAELERLSYNDTPPAAATHLGGCPKCANGVVGHVSDYTDPAVKAALENGAQLCDCEMGDVWRRLLSYT